MTQTHVSKFLFDTVFDAARSTAGQAGKAVPAAVSGRLYGEVEVAAIRAEAFDAGRAAGIEEANAELAARIASASESIAKNLAALILNQADLERAVTVAASAITLTTLRKLFPAYVQQHGGQEIETLLARCLAELRQEPRIAVRLHDTLLDGLRERLDELSRQADFSGRLVLLADAAVAPGDCLVEWADGGMQRDSKRLWADIEAAVGRALTAVAAQVPRTDGRQAAGEPQGD